MERRYFGHDIASRRMRMLKSHSADLRFDVENEGNGNNSANFTISLCSLRAIREKGKLKIQIA